uniref:MORF/ORRM1/DAG-like MORF domain-containing protein n=1 Tax=Kalanchoe fedtschenkoi TaxID=63787 RepID=A0A7N0UHT6_KALFE
MASMALRSRRLLPTVSSLVNNHFALSSINSLPRSSALPELRNSPPSPVGQCQSRLFRSSPVSMLCSTPPEKEDKVEDKVDPNDILFAGCDYNHWLITIDFPKDPKPSAEEMVETYVQTCAKGLKISEEEAKKRIYACSTTTYKGFQAVMTEEESEQFRALPNVIFILPDSYIDHVKKEYGGDKYVNGTIIPRPPPVQQNRGQGQFNRPMPRDNRNYGPRSYSQPNRRNYPPRGGMQNFGSSSQPQPHVGDYGSGDFGQ